MVPRQPLTRDHQVLNEQVTASQLSEGRLPFRITAGPVLGTLSFFRAGGVNGVNAFIRVILWLQMIRERLAPRRQDANDYEAASNLSRKVGLPEFPYKRLLKVLVALSTLISFPISAHATLYVVVLDAREIAIASDGKWLIVPGDNSGPVSQIKEKVIRLSPQLAFICDGRTEIDTTSVKIRAAELAQQINHEYQSQGGSNHVMAVLALDATRANRVCASKSSA